MADGGDGRGTANGGVAVLDPVADARWAAFVAHAPGAMIFHHPAWLALLRRTYRYPMAACCLLGADGQVTAGLPLALVRSPLGGRRLVSLPFSDLCPLLAEPSATERLVAAADRLRERMDAPVVEIRDRLPATVAAYDGARAYHHVLPLAATVGEVEGGFRRSSMLRGVRRARREGLVAERRTDDAALDAFVRLHLETRRRQGVPIQPRRFLRGLRALFAEDLGFVLVVRKDAAALAAAVFLHHGGVLTYKYGASDARGLALRPNNLLFWEAIRWGCERGMDALDLGRTHLGHESLRAFKRAWGAEERPLVYSRLGPGACEGSRRLPTDALATALRRSPAILTRLAGEAFYRYAA